MAKCGLDGLECDGATKYCRAFNNRLIFPASWCFYFPKKEDKEASTPKAKPIKVRIQEDF